MATDNVELVRNMYEAFGRGDFPAVMAAMAEDIEWNVPEVLPTGGRSRGLDGVGAFFGRLGSTWEDFGLELDALFGSGDRVCAVGRAGGVLDGVRMGYGFVHVWTVTDGLVVVSTSSWIQTKSCSRADARALAVSLVSPRRARDGRWSYFRATAFGRPAGARRSTRSRDRAAAARPGRRRRDRRVHRARRLFGSRLQEAAARVESCSRARSATALASQPPGPSHDQELSRRTPRERRPGRGDRARPGPRLRVLRAPLGLIWGERDNTVKLAVAQEIQRIRPGTPLEVIPDSGHIPHLEAPAEFVAALDRLLARLAERG